MTPPDPPILYLAAAIRDATTTHARPGSIRDAAVLVQNGRIVDAGPATRVAAQVGQPARVVDLKNQLLLPAMVNAHAHLDLTGLGPRPCPPGGFVAWLRAVIAHAPTDDDAITQAVQDGLRLSGESGVGYIADIARSTASVHARLSDATTPGVSYLECFGIATGFQDAAAMLAQKLAELEHPSPAPADRDSPIGIGVQPHAPYSAGLELYRAAVALTRPRTQPPHTAYPLSTHLAESLEELEFVQHARGPLADLLRDLGKWDPSIQPTAMHPVDYLQPVLEATPWLLAHCNFLDDRHIHALAHAGASVAYCPVASDYFLRDPSPPTPDPPSPAAPTAPRAWRHRYRQLLDAGVNVCLGTDSILCQNPDDPQPLSILSQARYLYRRDRVDPQTLLGMATVNGIQAMGLDPRLATLQRGAPARFMTVEIDPHRRDDPWTQALTNPHPAQPLTADEKSPPG